MLRQPSTWVYNCHLILSMGVCKLLQFVFPLWNFPEHSTCAFAPSLIQTDERNKKYHSSKKRREKKEKALQGTFPPPEDNTNCAKAKEKSGALSFCSTVIPRASHPWYSLSYVQMRWQFYSENEKKVAEAASCDWFLNTIIFQKRKRFIHAGCRQPSEAAAEDIITGHVRS